VLKEKIEMTGLGFSGPYGITAQDAQDAKEGAIGLKR